jgi:diadenosine tetraphosphatase ApaH/serine/threonine PP2A family protein phosphatase
MEQRTIVIGDIHGCHDELAELLEKAAVGVDDRVIAVGDLVTKGERNREVLDLFMSDPRFSAVIGNHDRALLRYWRGEISSLKASQRKTSDELAGGKSRYAAYLGSLPPMIDLGTHLVVHAGLRPGVPLCEQSIKDLTELRTLGRNRSSRVGTPWYEVYDGEKIVLFGHWPNARPRRGRRALGLDTGCVYGFKLTSYIIETGEFVSVKARRAYSVPKSSPRLAKALLCRLGKRFLRAGK